MSKIHIAEQTIFFQLTGVSEEERAGKLLQSVATLEEVMVSGPKSFTQLPNSPLSYWLTNRCKRVPAESGCQARLGNN